ncbi:MULTISPECIES: NUDIX domain-containing protein [unclassified Leifsonia]|uniref:NUDIX domain-containing protein n=1 Tax=unclassified Leifsonia TaxID=2663824 RepID=UPI0006F93B0B|nr:MULTISPECIES: NUDIX domain-containing protein [unclassified Leifsonia]KQX04937.1 DNA mismatch repair protein MutT [Leifsonia sp. Root1293]KRA08569.1 DNA mismatch repair protein MutT [Leifsonia sp. Root60]
MAAVEDYSEAYAGEHGRFALIPAAYVVLRRGDEVLLQRRAGTGYYDGYWAAGAAGHVEQGESVLAAAAREAVEELGVLVEVRDLETLTVMHRTGGTGAAIDERLDVFFSCTRWTGEPALQEDKASDLRWFALDALPEPVVPHELAVLEALRDGALEPVTAFGF